jgi:hypothetical protein
MTNSTRYVQGFRYSGLMCKVSFKGKMRGLCGVVHGPPALQEAPTCGVLPNIKRKMIEIRGLYKSEPKCGSLQLVEL